MNTKDWLSYLKERENSVNSYWNFFAIVSLAIIGFMIQSSSGNNPIPKGSLFIITLAFIAFAAANLFRMIKAQQQFSLIKEHIKNLIKPDKELQALKYGLVINDTELVKQNKESQTLKDGFAINDTEPVWRMTAFHLILDVCVVLMIWT